MVILILNKKMLKQAVSNPWTEEPGRLQSIGSHDLATKPPPLSKINIISLVRKKRKNTNIGCKDVKASGTESVDRGAWQATVHEVVRLSD